MWRPQTEAELKSAIENGTTVETSSFDAKSELPRPGKNKDLAKDICAMTVEGGLLVYGLGGANPTRPDELKPFETKGAPERVDSVAQTGIAEPPVIDVYEIDSDEQAGKGYLCIAVPPSPRAPHMLTVGEDNRYWGRGLTGNRLLSEKEVARLYERREQWEIDRGAALEAVVASYPFEFEAASEGVVVTTIRPVAPGRELLRVAANSEPIDRMMQDMARAAFGRDPYPGQGTSGLGEAARVETSQADRWIARLDRDLSSRYQAYAEFAADGSFTYWHSPILNGNPQGKFIMEQSVTRALYQPLAVAAWLYDKAGFFGSVDAAVAVMGIAECGGASSVNGFEPFGQKRYGPSEYRRSERITGEELRGDLDAVVRRLLRPLYDVISVNNYDPLAARRQ